MNFDFRRWAIGDWIFFASCAWLVWFAGRHLTPPILRWLAHPTDAVPAPFGERWIYGVAIWALLSITSLSTAILVENVRAITGREGRERGAKHPLTLALGIESLLLLTIVLGFAPDTALLLLYGEQDLQSVHVMVIIDRLLDGLCIVPFIGAFLLRVRSQPVIMFHMTKNVTPTDIWPTWAMVKDRLFMLTLALVIAVGVAIGK